MERRSLHAGLIVLTAALVYANTLENGFQLDDAYRVRDNPEIRQLHPLWRHFADPSTMSTLPRIGGYRPLLPLTLSINYAIAGHSLVGYHLTNLLFQILASLLAYFLCLRILGRGAAAGQDEAPVSHRYLALATALIFAIHPVSGIPVNYICARDLLMMEMFLLGSLWCYLAVDEASGRGRKTLYWALSLGGLALSLLSKPNAVVAPALIVAIEVTINRQRITSLRVWRRMAPFAAVIGSFFALTQWVLNFSQVSTVVAGTSAWSYALTQAKLHLVHYLPHAVWPWWIRQDPLVTPASGLADPAVWGGLLLIAGTLLLAVRLRQRWPVVSLCILAYWILLAPTSSVLPFHALAVDYRPYPSSVFLWLAIAIAVAHLLRPRWRLFLATLAVLYFGAASVVLNRTWRTGPTLWQHSVAHGGGPLAQHNLAMGTPDLPERIAHLRRALELAPDYILAKVNLCRALVFSGKVAEGLELCRRAAALDPHGAQTQHWVGRTYAERKRWSQALYHLRLATRLQPRNKVYRDYAEQFVRQMRNASSPHKPGAAPEVYRPAPPGR